MYLEVDELEKVKESNESLKQQIIVLESSENFEIIQLDKEIQTEEESTDDLSTKINELMEVNQKLQEENQNLIQKLKSESVKKIH